MGSWSSQEVDAGQASFHTGRGRPSQQESKQNKMYEATATATGAMRSKTGGLRTQC